eukprot:gene23389-biopygen2030
MEGGGSNLLHDLVPKEKEQRKFCTKAWLMKLEGLLNVSNTFKATTIKEHTLMISSVKVRDVILYALAMNCRVGLSISARSSMVNDASVMGRARRREQAVRWMVLMRCPVLSIAATLYRWVVGAARGTCIRLAIFSMKRGHSSQHVVSEGVDNSPTQRKGAIEGIPGVRGTQTCEAGDQVAQKDPHQLACQHQQDYRQPWAILLGRDGTGRQHAIKRRDRTGRQHVIKNV